MFFFYSRHLYSFQFYNLKDDSIGFYQPLKQDVIGEIEYVSLGNGSHEEKAVKGFFIESE